MERCDMTYASSSQIYSFLDEDEQEQVPATTFGWTISTLSELGAIELWNDGRHDTNRYDLETLDEDYLDSIEAVLEHGAEG